jgi:hypothetical protein
MDMDEIPEFLRRKHGEVLPDPIPTTETPVPAPKVEVVSEPAFDEGPSHYEKIQRGMRENASEYITEINGRYDEVLQYGHLAKNFVPYEYFRSNDIKPAIMELIVAKFKPQLEEFELSKTDPDLKEAYSKYSASERRTIHAFFDVLLTDAARWIDNQNAAKGPRKARKVVPAKKVKALKFKREDRELKLISIPPEKIVGAQELWTYNTKNKHLAHIVARGRSGLSVKGTTIQDFDMDISVEKVVRKPEEVLSKVLEKKKKVMEALKTKAAVPTGRINEHIILLRVG